MSNKYLKFWVVFGIFSIAYNLIVMYHLIYISFDYASFALTMLSMLAGIYLIISSLKDIKNEKQSK